MASAGNPNQPSAPFDVHMLFKPPPNSTAVPNSPGIPSSSPSFPPYPVPSHVPFSYPPQTAQFHQQNPHPFLHYAQDPLSNVYHQQPRPSLPYPSQITNPSQSPSPNSGARLMALLGTPPLETSVSLTSASSGDFIVPPTVSSSPSVISNPSRLSSSKQPHGLHITGSDSFVYDVDVSGSSSPPQLEVAPITKYVSDPGLVFGRQIAVNKSYICYGLRQGNIRVLNINTALRALLRGHTQRVTDMAFFAEDVHLLASASVDGRIYVWKISEGPGKDNKPEISGKIIVAIQVVSDGGSFHPRVCWHYHKQEILVVGIANSLLRIDMTKVGKGEVFSEEDEPLQCHIDKLINGVQLIGKHDKEVTDLSMSQWMMTRLASSSKDGTVKIWDEQKATPLVTLRPHEGHPVNCVSFLTSPHRPDHILLITAGLLNREVKIWSSTNEEGWLLQGESESWQCMQTLELTSSSVTNVDDAFFNQVVVLSQSGMILLANAKKNIIYAVHVDYGENPLSTRMDYLAEFSVKMPILSVTATSDFFSDNKHLIQVYCVQTQAIQQYALDLSLCLPPPQDSGGIVRELSVSRVSDDATSDSSVLPISSLTTASVEPSGSKISLGDSSAPVPSVDTEIVQRVDSGILPSVENISDQVAADLSVDKVVESEPLTFLNGSEDDTKPDSSDIGLIPNPPKFTHLITPSEILSKAISETETRFPEAGSSNLAAETAEVEVKVIAEAGVSVNEEIDSQREPQIRALDDESTSLSSQVKEPDTKNAEEEASNVEKVVSVEENAEQQITYPSNDETNERSDNISQSSDWSLTLESSSALKGKKQKAKQSQLPESSYAADSINEQNDFRVSDSSSPQALASIQELLNQVLSIQKNMQNQMNAAVSLPVTKEGKRVETALGRCIEKAIKANNDVLWARFQEEIAKRDKLEKERMQQVSTLISNAVNKDLPSILEKVLKKENSSLGPSLARSISPLLEKAVSSAIADSFQKGVGDKAVNQLEKSVNSKLEATVARQIQAQFQSSAKQYLQEGMRSCIEGTIVPSFEAACKTMFEQIDAGFQKGMSEHTTAVQSQFDSVHTPLAVSLRDAISSVLAVTQTLSNEVVDSQRKLLSALAAGNPKTLESMASLQANGPLSERVEAPVDPTKELTRLITERKFDEAFTAALQRSDVSIVSWLCSQVDIQALCSTSPLPLSQGVLLSLLQQLACDLSKDTTQKLAWMTQVAVAILPNDPMIALHVRPIFEQVYQILMHQRSLPTTSPADSTSIRLMLHVINSVLTGFK